MSTVTHGPARHLRILAAVAAASALLAAVAWPIAVRAAAPIVDWGTPTATAQYGKAISFSQPLAAATATPRRVELLLTFPGADGPLVIDRTADSAIGGGTLSYSFPVADASLLPNTVVSAQWRLAWADGSTSLGPSVSVTYADDRFPWRTREGSLVRIHWYQGDDAFGRRALAVAEKGIANAEQLLGVTETKPVDFFVYADQQAFYDALGPATRENVGGEAVPEIRTLFALITPDEVNASWVGIVIPHELTHLVFDTATHNPYHAPPRWLNEGLAVYLSQGDDASDRGSVRGAAGAGTLMPLSALTGQFPTTQDRFFLAYAESVSAVDFLIRQDGRDALVRLIRSYAAGVTDDEAFRQAIGIDVGGFERAWLADVGGRAPQQVGPQPAPAGPLPSAWASGGAAGGEAGGPGQAGASGAAGASSADGAAAAPGNAAPAPTGPVGPPTVVVALVTGLVVLGLAVGAVVARRRGRSGVGP